MALASAGHMTSKSPEGIIIIISAEGILARMQNDYVNFNCRQA
jgi:hypothetical protein